MVLLELFESERKHFSLENDISLETALSLQ